MSTKLKISQKKSNNQKDTRKTRECITLVRLESFSHCCCCCCCCLCCCCCYCWTFIPPKAIGGERQIGKIIERACEPLCFCPFVSHLNPSGSLTCGFNFGCCHYMPWYAHKPNHRPTTGLTTATHQVSRLAGWLQTCYIAFSFGIMVRRKKNYKIINACKSKLFECLYRRPTWFGFFAAICYLLLFYNLWPLFWGPLAGPRLGSWLAGFRSCDRRHMIAVCLHFISLPIRAQCWLTFGPFEIVLAYLWVASQSSIETANK